MGVRAVQWLSKACAALLIGGGVLAASDTYAQTIAQSLASAYQSNPTLRAQRAKLRATDEALPQAQAGWRPTITANVETGRSRVEGNLFAQSSGTQIRSPSSMNVVLSQPIFRGGRTFYETRQAEYRVQGERARLRLVEAQVLLDAAAAFMNVVRDQAVVELNVHNEQVLRRQREAAGDRFEIGEITRTDVAQAEARLAGGRADRIQAEGNLAASRATFKKVIGMAPERLVTPASLSNLPKSEAETLRVAALSFPAIVAANFDEKSAVEAVNIVEGELLPTVSLNGEISKAQEQFSTVDDTKRGTVSARVTIPLYQAGAVHSRLREARQIAGQRRVEVEEARRNAIEQATRAWSDMAAAQAGIVSLKSQVEAATIALDGVEQEALVGSRTVLDVLDAEQELLDAKVALVQAERDEFVASFRLKSAVGALTAEALALPVKFYDMNKHYDDVRGRWIGFGSDPE